MANNDIHFMRKELDRLQTKVANFDVTTEYAQSTSDTTAPTTGWSTTKPAPTEGYFVWARNIMNMGYGDVVTEPFCIGDGLEHILSIDVEYIAWSDAYQSPPQSSEYWQTTAPSIQSGQYIWTRTKTVTTFGTNYTDPLRVTGIEGADGQDGVSIKGDDGKGFDFIYYTTGSSSFSTTPADNVVRTQNQYNQWCDSPTPVDATHQYIYMSLRTTGNDGEWGHWSSPVKMSSIGEKGEDGEGFEIIFKRTNTETPVPDFMYNNQNQGVTGYTGVDDNNNHYQDADFVPHGWTDNQQGVDSDHQYEWASFRFKTVTNGNASWGNFNTPKIWATYSEDGTSSYIHIRYADTNNPANSSQVYTTPHRYIGIYIDNTQETNANKTNYNNPSLYSWSLFKPQEGIDFDGKFLHMKYASDVTFNQDGSVNTVTFTGNNGEDAGIWIGTLFDYTVADSTNGADYTWTKIEGNGISSMQEQYAMSTSYTTAPTTGWSNTPLENEVGKFYWTRTVISFTDGTSTTTNAICVSGADGDGVHNAYYCYDSLTTPTEPTYSTEISANSSTQSQNYNKWVEDPVAIDENHKYIYITTSTSYEYVNGVKRWKNFSEPALWSRYALDGTNGTNGSAGIGYEYAYKTVDAEIQPSDKPSGDVSATTGHGWTKVPVPMTSTYKYMYISYRTVQGSTKFDWSNSALWSQFGEKGDTGASGKDGLGMEHIFYLANTEVDWENVNNNTNPANWTTKPNTDDYYGQDITGNQWTDDATGVDENHKYEYCSIRRKEYDTDGKTAKWGAFSTPSLWAKFGEKGDKGDTGDAGQGFEYVYKLHGSDSTPTTPSGNITNTSTRGSWATKPLSMDSTDYPYTFISYRTSDENGDWGSWSTPALWSKFGEQGEQGDKGADGIGMEHIFCRTDKDGYIMTNEGTRLKRSNADVTLSASSNSNPALWSANQSDDYYDTSWGWYDNAQGVTESIPYEYVAIRTKRPNADGDGVWGTFTAYKLWAKFGADGKSITRVVNYYVASDSGSTAPSTGWKTDISQVTDFGSTKRYLWNYEKSYSGNTESDFVSESNAVVIAYWTEDGHEGKGISSVVEHYAVSSSSSSAPVDSSSDWHHTTDSPFVMPVTTTTYKYLWNYETLNFTDGSHHDTTKRIIGTHGETGASIVFAYYTSDNANYSGSPSGSLATGNNKGNNTWCDTPYPTSASYPYLYVSTKTTASGSTWSSASLMSKYGLDGLNGNHGTGYEYAYYTTNGTPNPSAPSTVSTNGNLNSWQKTPVAITDSATKIYISYRTVSNGQPTSNWSTGALFSIKGDKGDDGYSIDSIVNYYAVTTSTTPPLPSDWETDIDQVLLLFDETYKYLWNYEECYNDNSELVSTTGTDPAIIGVYGADGKGITSITEKYAKSSSSTNAPSSWSTSIPTLDSTNKYMWNQTTISYTKGADSVNTRVIGVRGENGYDGVGFEIVFKLMDSENPTWNNNNNPHTISTSATGFQSAGYIPFSSSSTNKWTNDPSGVSSSHKYEFASVRTSDENRNWGAFSQPSLFSKYGDDGIGVEYIYRVNNSTTAPTFTNNQDKSSFTGYVTRNGVNYYFQDDDFVPSGWSDDPVSVSSSNKYCWVCERRKTNGSWGDFGSPSIWARYGEDGAKGDEGERGTRIIEITKAPSYNSSGWHDDAMGVGVYYYYRKEIKYVLSESGETEVKIGDYLKYDTTLYLVEYMNNYWVCLVETELAPDMENIDAKLFDGKESSEFMTSVPDIHSISQSTVGTGSVECWKFGQLIIVNINGCTVTNTLAQTSGWESIKKDSSNVINIPASYRPSSTLINACGTSGANNTKEMQVRITDGGNIHFKRLGFLNCAVGDSEIVSATFVYFHDTRTATTLTDLHQYGVGNNAGACIGDYLEVQLKTGNTNLSGYPIVFNINSVNYQRTTDSNGKAKLLLNLPKNTAYTWSARYNGNNTYRPATVGQSNMMQYACGGTLSVDNADHSYIYRNTPFTGTVLNNHSNPVRGVTVTVTVEDTVSFSSVTDENGKFKIYHPNDGIVYQNNEWYCTFTTDTVKTSTITANRYLVFKD